MRFFRRMRQWTETAATWTAKNPILLDGEIGIEINTGKLKTGNGVSAWVDLPYSNQVGTVVGDASQLTGTAPVAVMPDRVLTTNGERPVGKGELVLNVRDFGAVGDGVTDDTAAIQAAIDAATEGTTVLAPAGRFLCNGVLDAKAGVTLHLSSGAHVVKGASSGRAFIANADYTVKVSGFRITGPGKIGAADLTKTGQIVFLHGDDIALSDFTIDTYAGGQAILIGGDRCRLSGVTVTNPDPAPGCGGIRMYGGSNFRAIGCHVVAGDDALMFTPVASAGHPVRDMDISDAAYIGCTGGSLAARFMVVPVSMSPPGTGGLTCSVTNVSFMGCHGFGSKRGIVVSNTDSTGEIANVGFVDCSVDMTAGVAGGGQDVLIDRRSGTGRVRDIRFQGLCVIRPAEAALGTTGDATTGEYVEGVTLQDCILGAPRDGSATLKPLAVDGLTIRGGRIDGTGQSRIVEGGTGVNASRRINISDAVIAGIGDGWAGIRLPATSSFRIRDVSFEPSPGAATSEGVALAAGSVNGVIAGCDFTAVSAGVTGTIDSSIVQRDNFT